jgi:cytochrome c-type biogenesis protein CcmH/NrfF
MIYLVQRRTTTFSVLLSLVVFGLFALLAPAETPDEQKARVERIENAVLAPCCYREPVSRHQSEIAVKMRLEIAKWVAMGKTDQEILNTYVGLYGAKVLVDPRTAPRWWMQWVPWLVLVFGIAVGAWLLHRWHSRAGVGQPPSSDSLRNLPDLEDD